MLDYFRGVEKGVKYTKNLEIKLNPDLPCESDNTFTFDKSVFDFYKYFKAYKVIGRAEPISLS